MKRFLLAALLFAGVAQAQTRVTLCNASTPNSAICVMWEAPGTFTDGTPISLAITYRVEQKSGTGTFAPIASGVTLTRHYVTGLQPGVYTFRVIATAAGKDSAPSNEPSRTVEQMPPTAPVIQVVQVIIGVDHVPVFTVLKDGSRSNTVGGVATVGTECEGPVLFRYRSREWRKPVSFKPWGVSSTARVAAPCA